MSDFPYIEEYSRHIFESTFVNTAKYADNIINYRKRLSSALGISHSKILTGSNTKVNQKLNDETTHRRFYWPVTPRKKPALGSPDLVLDMPDIDTTTYNHIIDWGKKGHIATIFHGEVHLWESSNSPLAITQTDKSILECVRWNPSGTLFAVSRSISRLSIIDVQTIKIVRTVQCKCMDCKITAIEWTEEDIVIAGCSSGSITFINKNNKYTACYYKLLKEHIIDIKLSCREKYLLVSTLTGSSVIYKMPFNWSPSPSVKLSSSEEDYIKSTSWHPFKESFLAVGEIHGGVTIWDVNNEKNVDNNVVTPYFKNSCYLDCLTFNPLSAELLVSFFHDNNYSRTDNGCNFLTVFSDLHTRVDEVKYHLGRVPHAIWDGTGTKLATAGSDENLIIWNFFGSESEKRIANRKEKENTDILKSLERYAACIR